MHVNQSLLGGGRSYRLTVTCINGSAIGADKIDISTIYRHVLIIIDSSDFIRRDNIKRPYAATTGRMLYA